jgi:hypothetical protein
MISRVHAEPPFPLDWGKGPIGAAVVTKLVIARPDCGVAASSVIIRMLPLPSSLTIGRGLLGE